MQRQINKRCYKILLKKKNHLKDTGCEKNKIDRTNLKQEREKYSYVQSKINKKCYMVMLKKLK